MLAWRYNARQAQPAGLGCRIIEGNVRDEQTGKHHHCLSGSWSRRGVLDIQREVTDGCKHHKADEHPDPTGDERLAPSEVFNDVQTPKGRTEVHAAENHLRDESIVDTRAVEDDRTVVEEVVGTGQLLKRLQYDPQTDAIHHPRALEHLDPAEQASLGSAFCFELLLDLGELVLDHAVVRRDAVEFRHGMLCLVDAPMAVVISRAFRKEDDPNAQDKAPEERDPERDAPGSRVSYTFRAVVDAVGNKDAECDEQLIRTWETESQIREARRRRTRHLPDHGASNLPRRTLTLVHGNQQGARSDSETSDKPPHHHLVPLGRGRGYLDDEPDVENDTPKGDRPFAADTISQRACNQRTKQCTNR